jgi:hypothetical protein
MANTPNQVTITVTNAEVAAELEALATAYEETVQKLRYEADRLRQGFNLTLNVSATQVHIAKPTLTFTEDESETLPPSPNQARAENLIDPRPATERMVFNPVAEQQKPQERVSDRLAPKANLLRDTPTDTQVAAQWIKGPHFLPWGNDITTCGINTKGTVRKVWDERKGDWVHPTRPGVMKSMLTAQLKFVDCPDCRSLIKDAFIDRPTDIEWMNGNEAYDPSEPHEPKWRSYSDRVQCDICGRTATEQSEVDAHPTPGKAQPYKPHNTETTAPLPDEALKLIDEMTKTTAEEEE